MPGTQFSTGYLSRRDDDIPAFRVNDVCQLGIIGQNSLLETQRLEPEIYGGLEEVVRLGFGRCRLSIAVPNDGI